MQKIYKANIVLKDSCDEDGYSIRVSPPLEFEDSAYEFERDAYGVLIREDRLIHPDCFHAIPCLTFKCISSLHRGSRNTPWCRGGDDAPELFDLLGSTAARERDVGWCDDCWAARMRGFIRKRVRDRLRWRGCTRLSGAASISEYKEMLWSRGTWLPPKRKIR